MRLAFGLRRSLSHSAPRSRRPAALAVLALVVLGVLSVALPAHGQTARTADRAPLPSRVAWRVLADTGVGTLGGTFDTGMVSIAGCDAVVALFTNTGTALYQPLYTYRTRDGIEASNQTITALAQSQVNAGLIMYGQAYPGSMVLGPPISHVRYWATATANATPRCILWCGVVR